jgi:3'-phosphoadenosine 5'-phosphosulfate sulfotransferase (PAPS reductase)/FAD synthetase
MSKLVIASTSGGESSMYMAIRLKQERPDTLFVYANTGEELEATLAFVNDVDKSYDLGIVWLEAVINPEKGKGTTYKVVDFDTASRKSEPFEEVIKVYGLPSPSYLH